MKNKTQVFEFVFTDCVYTSDMRTISLHRTKKGAYRAMRNFLETKYIQWRENGIRYGKQQFKFGMYYAWTIRPIKLEE